MALFCRMLILIATLASSVVLYADDDIVTMQLEKALVSYDEAYDIYIKSVTTWFDRRESEARSRGDKTLVDQISEERQEFTAKNIQPKTLPRTIKNRLATVKRNTELAYKAAIKEYTKAGRDEEASATEKELIEFEKGRTIPEDAIQFQGKFYKIIDSPTGWQNAKTICQEKGGHLAIIRNSDENEFLVQQLEKANIDSAWVGASDEKTEGEWVWIDGSKVVDFSNWGGKEPNDFGGEDYLCIVSYIKGQSGWRAKWSDQGSQSKCFVCQWD